MENNNPEIAEAIARLKRASEDTEKFGKLHEIERMIVTEVLHENRHLKCTGCLSWINSLISKIEQINSKK